MPIKDRNLKPGMKLIARYHKNPYTADVVDSNGKIMIRLDDGREFKSVSGAGKAVTGHACDGYIFWSEAEAETASKVTHTEQEKPADHPTNPPPLAAHIQVLFKTPNQKGAPKGQTKWYCSHCTYTGSFLVPEGTTPEKCPNGHQNI